MVVFKNILLALTAAAVQNQQQGGVVVPPATPPPGGDVAVAANGAADDAVVVDVPFPYHHRRDVDHYVDVVDKILDRTRRVFHRVLANLTETEPMLNPMSWGGAGWPQYAEDS